MEETSSQINRIQQELYDKQWCDRQKWPSCNPVVMLNQRETGGHRRALKHYSSYRDFYHTIPLDRSVIMREQQTVREQIMSWTPDGQYLICFGNNFRVVKIYFYVGVQAAKKANSDNIFQSMLKPFREVYVPHDGFVRYETIFFTPCSRYIFLVSSTAVPEAQLTFPNMYNNYEAVPPGNLTMENYVFFTVDIQKGTVCSEHRFPVDRISLVHGISISGYNVCIFSQHHQVTHILNIDKHSGNINHIRDIGPSVNEDDSLYLTREETQQGQLVAAYNQDQIPAASSSRQDQIPQRQFVAPPSPADSRQFRPQPPQPPRPLSNFQRDLTYKTNILTGLKQRLNTFLFKRAKEKGTVPTFLRHAAYRHDLRVDRGIIFDEFFVFLRYLPMSFFRPPDGEAAVRDLNNLPCFFVVLDWRNAEILDVYESFDERFLSFYEEVVEYLTYPMGSVNWPGAEQFRRISLLTINRYKRRGIVTKNQPDAIRRCLNQLPLLTCHQYKVSMQSPYLDPNIYGCDDRFQIGMMVGKVRIEQADHSIRFFSRRANRCLFRMSLLSYNEATRQVAMLFHPCDPLCLAIDRTRSDNTPIVFLPSTPEEAFDTSAVKSSSPPSPGPSVISVAPPEVFTPSNPPTGQQQQPAGGSRGQLRGRRRREAHLPPPAPSQTLPEPPLGRPRYLGEAFVEPSSQNNEGADSLTALSGLPFSASSATRQLSEFEQQLASLPSVGPRATIYRSAFRPPISSSTPYYPQIFPPSPSTQPQQPLNNPNVSPFGPPVNIQFPPSTLRPPTFSLPGPSRLPLFQPPSRSRGESHKPPQLVEKQRQPGVPNPRLRRRQQPSSSQLPSTSSAASTSSSVSLLHTAPIYQPQQPLSISQFPTYQAFLAQSRIQQQASSRNPTFQQLQSDLLSIYNPFEHLGSQQPPENSNNNQPPSSNQPPHPPS